MKISIIIPAYNAEKTILPTLKALQAQNYPKNKYEIIVVDDGSTDNTEKTVKSLNGVIYLKQKNSGPARARNRGAKVAKGKIILFTDADCIPDKNWIKNMVSPFKDKKIAGVSGTYKTLNKKSIVARFTGYEIDERHETMKKQKTIDFIGTFSAAYRKAIFHKFRGFDTAFKTSSGEDPELSYRIAKAGYKMIFQPKAFVYHKHPASILAYLKQKYWRGYWRNHMYFGQHEDKLVKSDSYTSKTMLPQLLLSSLLPLMALLLLTSYPISSVLLWAILSYFIIAVIFNLKLIYFILKREVGIGIISSIILTLRNIVVPIGMWHGFIVYGFPMLVKKRILKK